MNEPFKVLCYGAGVNSSAVIFGLHDRLEMPEVITFSDTGGEKPHTYEVVRRMSKWLVERNYAPIVVLRSPNETLEESVLRLRTLPSVVFGFRTCSQRFKKEPQEKYLNHHEGARAVWARGGKVIKMIGFDADEPHRAVDFEDEKYRNSYPLIEWGWGREECERRINQEGLTIGKSACFFCPSSRKSEIAELKAIYPELAERAIAMERNNEKGHVDGLGRHFSWEAVLKQTDMFGFQGDDDESDSLIDISCECYDGE